MEPPRLLLRSTLSRRLGRRNFASIALRLHPVPRAPQPRGVAMNRIAILIAALTLTATAAFAAEGNFEKTLAVSGAPSLSVATGSGYVHVYSGSGSQVHIIGR